MKVDVLKWDENSQWSVEEQAIADKSKAQLVIFFASPEFYSSNTGTKFLRDSYPKAQIIGCSTGGEILGGEAFDNSAVACAIEFANTKLAITSIDLKEGYSSKEAGEKLVENLAKEGLKHVYIISDGIKVNGSELIKGLFSKLPKNVTVTGGLAGDDANFKQTFVTINERTDTELIVAIGFYGEAIQVSYGSVGGWDAFGPERVITKSQGNVLFELDNKPALELYKSYLGDEAKDLPGSGLLYPLNIRENEESEHELVRTIVGIDEENQSMIFAGDVPQGYISRLMKGNFNNLVEGALKAATMAQKKFEPSNGLALSVSCIGRKLLLGQRISDETEIVNESFNGKIPIIGFYSYGEICHHSFTNKCDLHNQTMTITYLSEKE